MHEMCFQGRVRVFLLLALFSLAKLVKCLTYRTYRNCYITHSEVCKETFGWPNATHTHDKYIVAFRYQHSFRNNAKMLSLVSMINPC